MFPLLNLILGRPATAMYSTQLLCQIEVTAAQQVN